MKTRKKYQLLILDLFAIIFLFTSPCIYSSNLEPILLPISSNLILNKDLEDVIARLLKKTENYMNTSKEVDKRVLLEAYGFALGLSHNIGDLVLKTNIEKKILQSLKEFAFEDLRLVKDIELSNLPSNHKNFKEAFENIRLQFKVDKSKGLRSSLAVVDDSYKKIVREIINYLHGMLGGPPLNSRHVIASVGSLATRMTTPYSDIEYIILIDQNTDENKVYFTNFCDLFELFMIGFGESPIYKAEAFLAEFKNYSKYLKKGSRIDEHKRPQDINRMYGLINTPEELLAKIPLRIIHEPGNHLTSALLSTGYLEGDSRLYDRFEDLFKECLRTSEYLNCLRKLLEEDIRASNGYERQLQNNLLRNEFEKEIEVKEILIHGIHLARTLTIFLISVGEDIRLEPNFFEIIDALKKGDYITQEQYQNWYDFVSTLFGLCLELQIKSQSAEAKLTLNELHQKFNVQTLIQQLQEITNFVQVQLEKRKNIQNSSRVTSFTKNSLVWNLPRQDHLFVGREKLLEELEIKLHPQPRSQLVIQKGKELQERADIHRLFAVSVCAGMGGVGKTQLALQYIHHAKQFYTLKGWFFAENLDQLKQQYIEFAKILGYKEEKPSITTALPYVKEWLSKHPGWLLVYDNVNNYAEIKGYLPERGGSVILTTRQHQWPSAFKTLEIDIMPEEEAIEVIQSSIQREIIETEKETLKELVKILGYLPLALVQAGAYIQQTQTTVIDYLNLYKDYEQELLADTTLPEGTNIFPVANTWNISIAAIANEAKAKNQPPLALHLLSVCAYLAPERISHNLLLTWFKKAYPTLGSPELALNRAIEQLWRYSLINSDGKGSIRLHRLVQAVVRHQHKQTSEKKDSNYPKLTLEWYNTLLKAIHIEFSNEGNILETELRRRNLLLHLQSLIVHYDALFFNNKTAVLDLALVLDDIGDTLFHFIGSPKVAKFYYERSLNIKERLFGKNDPRVANTLEALANTYILPDPDTARQLLERTLKIKERHFGKNDPRVANTLENLGHTYRQLGDPIKAKELLESALKITENYFGKDHPRIANSLEALGTSYRQLGYAKQAKELLERALKIKKNYYGKEHWKTISTLEALGYAYRQLSDPKKAVELLQFSMKIKEQHYGKDHWEMASALEDLGNSYRQLGDTKKARQLLEEALKIKENHYGNEHWHTAYAAVCLGLIYEELGDTKHAKELAGEALTIQEKFYGKNHWRTASTLENLGNAYKQLGDIKRAKEFLEQALAIKKLYYGEYSWPVGSTLTNLGDVYQALGNNNDAKILLEEALKIQKNFYGEDHWRVSLTLTSLGDVYNSLGDYKQAKEILERALTIKEHFYGKDHPIVADTLCELGNVIETLGDISGGQYQIKHAYLIVANHPDYGKNHPLAKYIFKFIKVPSIDFDGDSV